jgi:hypothetical protein
MSYLYNLFEGSLADLEQRVRNAEPPNTVEALEEAVDSTWQGVHPIIANLLDWHEQEALLEQATNLPGNGPALVSKLFTAPPLGIEPYDFGFQGGLTSHEVAELRALLEGSVAESAARIESDPPSWDLEVDQTGDAHEGPARLLIGLRPVTPGKDVILLLG